MSQDHIAFLRLLQLADSALPIGATAHSFGLETLVAEGLLDVEHLEPFLRDYLQEAGRLECLFFLRGYRLADQIAEPDRFIEGWLKLNERLSALKTARESRSASAALGRRFLRLAHELEIHALLPWIMQTAKARGIDTHYAPASGLVCGILGINETAASLAYLQQALSCLIFACQRLMPLGQSRASQLLWSLKPVLLSVIQRSEEAASHDEAFNFTSLVEIGSMRHPALTTRLFIS